MKKYDIKCIIVNVYHGPLLYAKACNILRLIKYCNTITKENDNTDKLKIEAKEVIQEYHDVFTGYGDLPGEVNLELDSTVKPVIQQARKIPITLKKDLKQKFDNIIEKVESTTDWVSNILIVKRNFSFRIYLDPIPLNKALKRPHFKFITIDEFLPELEKVKVFTTVDTKKGFLQIKLNDQSSKLTTF